MKRLSQRQKQNFIRTAKKRAIRKFGRKRASKRKVFIAKMWFRNTVWDAVIPDTSKIKQFPAVMCFNENPAATLRTLSSIRSGLNKYTGNRLWLKPDLNPRKRVKISSYVSMESVKIISTSAALVLAAEYERKTKGMDEPPPIFDLQKWDRLLLNKFEQIGFFERFGYVLTNDSQPKADANILTVPFYSGTKTKMPQYDAKLHNLVEHIDSSIDVPTKMRLALNNALGEAATNAREHAYVSGFGYKYPPVGLWWATGSASKRDRKIVISMYDQGVSIPISYPKLPLFSQLRETLQLFDDDISTPYQNDALLIRAAATHGKTGRKRGSSSGKSLILEKSNVGGYGLPQIKDAIDLCGGGELMILSRGGRYIYRVVNGVPEEQLNTYNESVGGTLIEWNVTIPETV